MTRHLDTLDEFGRNIMRRWGIIRVCGIEMGFYLGE